MASERTTQDEPEASEVCFRELFDNMTEGFALGEVILDTNGKPVDYRILEINEAFLRQTGLPRSIVGQPVAATLKQVEPVWIERYGRVALTGEAMRFTEYNEATQRHYEVYSYRPAPGRFANLFRDITAEKARQDALARSEARYRALFESIDEGFCIIEMLFDAEGRPVDYVFIDTNSAFERQTGLKDAVGRRMRDLAPEHEAHWFEIYGRVALTGEPVRFENHAAALGFYYDVYAFRFGAPEERRVAVLFEDVTEKKVADKALRESENLLTGILEQLPVGVGLIDHEGRGTYANPILKQYLPEMIPSVDRERGNRWRTLDSCGNPIPPPQWPGARALRGESVLPGMEFSYTDDDGREHWLLVSAIPLLGADGQNLGAIAVMQDITERKQTEDALRKSEARFVLLTETAGALLVTTDPQALMEELCRKVMLHLDCDVFVNFMADEAAGRLRLNACAGIPEEEIRKIEWLDYGVAVCGCVARDRLRMIAEDISKTPDARTELVKSYGVQAYCCHPLIAGERLIGTLSFGATRRARFSADDVELMQAVSHQVSVAMERILREEALRESEAKLRESEEHLKRAQEIARLGSWELDLVDNVLIWSDEAYRIFGLRPHEFGATYEAFLDIVHPEDREAVNEAYSSSLREGRDSYEIEHRIVQKSTGEIRHVQEKCTHFRDENGKITRSVGMTHDITERKHIEEELKLAATVYQDSSEAMLVSDADNNIIAVNQAFTQITGYTSAEVIGKNPSMLKSDRHDSRFYHDMWEQIRATGRFRGDVWNTKKDGTPFAAQITINTIFGPDGSPHRHVALISDITEKKRSEDIIWSQANFDALTGLPNRHYFRERLEHEIRNARRVNQPMALMLLDLDGFKDINDTLGHDKGDLLLKKAAERLKGCVRDIDMVARLGGDEFTVILSELHDPENAVRVARHILKVLSDPIELDDQLAYVSASIGITLYPQDAAEIEGLIKNADQAMYAAKQEGKNQYHYFTQSMQENAVYRMRLINDLRVALDGNQFEVVYQPIVELASGKIQKAEALIRWHHPIRGLINPIEFISAAEDTGMIASFGNWVFHHAARQVMRWRERFHPEFQISVNISPVQFRKDGIDPSVWLHHLQSLDLPGHGIVIEITEGLLLDASSRVISQLARLRELGIEVALDDFGTGYSSLSYLQKFDIDYIKIDRAFVRNLAEGSDDLVLCQAILAMAHKLGLKVIAEGVESGRQHEILANSGCDFAQGFLFSRPVPAHALEELLRSEPFTTQQSLKL